MAINLKLLMMKATRKVYQNTIETKETITIKIRKKILRNI